jgi:hypothetical protein
MDSMMADPGAKSMTRLEVACQVASNMAGLLQMLGLEELIGNLGQCIEDSGKNRFICHNTAESWESELQAVISDAARLLQNT